jgi:hypothetical protein
MLRMAVVLMFALFARPAVESVHVAGPNGLEGWTESVLIDEVKEQGPLPVGLVIARNGRVIRKIDGDPFVWKWRFQPDDRRVAYETGPLHSSMMCVLADIRTGKQLEAVDCFGELPADAPPWVKELERNTR